MTRPACLGLLLAIQAFLSPAWGQLSDPSRRAEGAGSRLTNPTLADQMDQSALSIEDENAFAPASPGDDDLGQQLILKQAQKERWMHTHVDFFGYWTDNAANAAAGEESDFFWGGRVAVGAQPRITNRLYLDSEISQHMFRYDEYDFLNFESLEATAGLIYVEPRLMNSIFFLQGHFNRITNDDFSNALVNSWSIRAGVQKVFFFNRRNSLHVSLMGDWDLDTDVAQLERHEYIADLNYKLKIMRDLVFSAACRFTYFDYQQLDRADVLNLAGASLTWSPRKWLDVYASANFSFNESDLDFFDYEAANIGAGVGCRVRF